MQTVPRDKGRQADALSVEQTDDRVRKARKIAERCNNLRPAQGRLLERYLKADLNIAIRRVGGGSRKQGFLFSYRADELQIDSMIEADQTYPPREYGGFKQASVFSSAIHIVEGPQKAIPSLIRPQVFDDQLVGAGEPLYLFFAPTSSGVIEGVKAGTNGKVDVFVSRLAVALSQDIRQNVEGAPDAMKDGPGLCIDDGGNGRNRTQIIEFPTGVRIGVNPNGIGFGGFSVPPIGDTLLQDWELGYGPIDSSFGV